MFKRLTRSTIAMFAMALTLIMPVAPAAAQAAGVVTPAVGTHPHAVATVSHKRVNHALRFSCQDRQLDDPTGIACLSPQSVRAAYGVDSLLNRGTTGEGRTIVIIDAFQNPFIRTDLALFDAAFDLPGTRLNIIAPDGLTPFDINDGNQVGWSAEIALDVQWAHAIAPGATIDLVLAKSNNDADINSATKFAVDHNLGDTISQSFGEAESCVSPADAAAQHRIFRRATSRKITLFASSGDQGAAQPNCDGTSFIKSASSPATDPLVTAVGGTNLVADTTSGAYISERAWSDRFSGCFPTNQFGCSGGGFSDAFRRPGFQSHAVRSRGRGVPDVAYNAGVDAGVLAHWGVGNILNGFAADNPNIFFIFGGTSAGSPQWAGLAALADQTGHHRIGSINDDLYKIGRSQRQSSAAFHDITTGNNNFDTITGFQARVGWDAVTGLGSPKANNLVPMLAHSGRD
jgi:subtilase family serine protease